jgi:hypothetical protein
LEDVFGRTFPEGEFFKVDRDAVLRYKVKVEANLASVDAPSDASGKSGFLGT